MATLTVQKPSVAGAALTYVSAAGGGDEFLNTGREFLHVVNAGGGNITVTFNSQTLCNYGFDHDMAVTVNAGTDRMIGPFDTVRFNDANTRIQVTYSGVTSLTVAAIASA